MTYWCPDYTPCRYTEYEIIHDKETPLKPGENEVTLTFRFKDEWKINHYYHIKTDFLNLLGSLGGLIGISFGFSVHAVTVWLVGFLWKEIFSRMWDCKRFEGLETKTTRAENA